MITTIQKGVKTHLVNESTGVQAEAMPALLVQRTMVLPSQGVTAVNLDKKINQKLLVTHPPIF